MLALPFAAMTPVVEAADTADVADAMAAARPADAAGPRNTAGPADAPDTTGPSAGRSAARASGPARQDPRVNVSDVATALSDYSRRILLLDALAVEGLTRQELATILRAARHLESSYVRMQVIDAIAPGYDIDRHLAAAYVAADAPDASGAVAWSDADHQRILAGVVGGRPIDVRVITLLVGGLATVESDYEKAVLLEPLIARYRADPRMRPLLADVAHTLESDYQRRRLLTLLDFDQPPTHGDGS